MEKRYYLGIDVSKGYADFTILNKEKTIVEENFQLDDTFEGHQQLFNFLKTYFAEVICLICYKFKRLLRPLAMTFINYKIL